MTSTLARSAGLALFEKHLKNYQPVDPLYESYTDRRGKTRQRKKELPPGLSKRDARILRKVKYRAHHLDNGFVCCGMRFGWTSVLGIIPVVGDVADAYLNYVLIIKKARQAELPNWLVRRMLLNNMISISIGLIPVVGVVMLATFKANSRNATLLEEYLRVRGDEFLKAENDRVYDPTVTRPGAGLEEEKDREKKPGIFSYLRHPKQKDKDVTDAEGARFAPGAAEEIPVGASTSEEQTWSG